MKKIVLAVLTVLITSFTAISQSFFFIGEKSYPCSDKYTLQSNSESDYISDPMIVFAKDGSKGLIIISSALVSTVRISGKLIIYLDDGTVITCVDRGIKDNVDDIASSAYYLTNEELNKIKNSNVNTIRYIIKCAECLVNPIYEGNYSASNKGSSKTDFTAIIKEFYDN